MTISPSPLEPVEFVTISRSLRDDLIAYGRGRLPYEACGLLLGRREGGFVAVNGLAPVRNAHPRPERAFRFAPDDWIRAAYAAQRNRQQLVGFFHSHPGGGLAPSRSDEEGWTGGGVCAIVGLAAGTPGGLDRVAVYEPDPRTSNWRQVPIRTI
ncbi:Mov34/MPN/PAD-1 family protein [Cohnella zeiphila]|uniref:M67 family metallopeptidase n=1 Tax=Cohnella zeiphila TaxID=2761120 RepID=A0A7X0SG78_9BACL|nr:M67 family metallopeptidase [Cohnella zeiphila]MBB6729394.1 M67 family metallopeptidase [Cohnella zeiphila]